MEDFAIRLYDLLETTPFEQLQPNDRAFVLKHMTEEEYRAHASVNLVAAELDYDIPDPLPLSFASDRGQQRIAFWKRPVPLYQAIAAAAAIAIIFFMASPGKRSETTLHYAAVPIDTLSSFLSANSSGDTIVKVLEVVRFREKLVRDTITIVRSVYDPKRETRMLEAGAVSYPVSIQTAGHDAGVPLSQDRTAGLLPARVPSEAFGR